MRRRERWGLRAGTRLALLTTVTLVAACVTEERGGRFRPSRSQERPARASASAAVTSGPPSRLFLVSVPGLTPAAYLSRPNEAFMPSLAQLATDGVAAERVEPVSPAVSLFAHAALATGALPSQSGVIASDLSEGLPSATSIREAAPMRAISLWQAAASAGLTSALLGWPGAEEAQAEHRFPEVLPAVVSAWSDRLQTRTTPALLERARRLGANDPVVAVAGQERDRFLVNLTCDLAQSPQAPALVLLRLTQTEDVLRTEGPHGLNVRAAFARVDQEIERLLQCLRRGELLEKSALVVVGDRGIVPIHTMVQPNTSLAAAGLIVPKVEGASLVHRWSAFARSYGGSAFVYARSEEDAVLARHALSEAAQRTRAFRIVTAAEMLRVGADPQAWFGLEAEPGFFLGEEITAPLLHPTTQRGGDGYLMQSEAQAAGFVAFGRGVRSALRLPRLRQTDIAPTLARWLGLQLPELDGRPVVGIFQTPPVAAPANVNTVTESVE